MNRCRCSACFLSEKRSKSRGSSLRRGLYAMHSQTLARCCTNHALDFGNVCALTTRASLANSSFITDALAAMSRAASSGNGMPVFRFFFHFKPKQHSTRSFSALSNVSVNCETARLSLSGKLLPKDRLASTTFSHELLAFSNSHARVTNSE